MTDDIDTIDPETPEIDGVEDEPEVETPEGDEPGMGVTAGEGPEESEQLPTDDDVGE